MLKVKYFGKVRYEPIYHYQRVVAQLGNADELWLQEHPHVYTVGRHGDTKNLLDLRSNRDYNIIQVDRGGDVTYHGPGQLVGYIIKTLPHNFALREHVDFIERAIVGALNSLGVTHLTTIDGYKGVWVDENKPRKICQIGVRVKGNRSYHGFSLNYDPDLDYFKKIIPCGISEYEVTSLVREGATFSYGQLIKAIITSFNLLSYGSEFPFELNGRIVKEENNHEVDLMLGTAKKHAAINSDSSSLSIAKRLQSSEIFEFKGIEFLARKPDFAKKKVFFNDKVLSLRKKLNRLGLNTVCEEAACPNLSECWSNQTATFMIGGHICTRSCAFCDVATGKPVEINASEPKNVARAVEDLSLDYVVVTGVARDDLADCGASNFAKCVEEIRLRCPGTKIELLIPDFKFELGSLEIIAEAKPDVINHNIETVLRLQRLIRPQAKYEISMAVLAYFWERGFITKSGLMVGLGETTGELETCFEDLSAVGVKILTIGQYLRPSRWHVPVIRYYAPEEFKSLAMNAMEKGILEVEASSFARSSYKAKSAMNRVLQGLNQ